MQDWLEPHLFGVLLGIEIMWVAGFLAVFVIYFAIKLKIKKNKINAGQKPGQGQSEKSD